MAQLPCIATRFPNQPHLTPFRMWGSFDVKIDGCPDAHGPRDFSCFRFESSASDRKGTPAEKISAVRLARTSKFEAAED